MSSDFTVANKSLRECGYVEAIGLYNSLVESNSDFIPYSQNLALAYLGNKDYENASGVLRNTLALDPWSPWLQNKFREVERLRQEKRKKSDSPFLSIIVPVYNSGKYLRKCLSSILNQHFKNFELIIINDGSTDGSWGIIKEYRDRDRRIKVITNEIPSGNPGSPRNQALKIAKGQYIGFVDSDDWLELDYYSTLCAKAIEEVSDIVFSGGFRNNIGTNIDIRKYNNGNFNNSEAEFYKYHDSFMIWDKIFKADMIRYADAWLADTKAAVDVPFIFKVYYYSHIISYCNDLVGYNYRRESSSSVTVNFRKKSDCQFEFSAYLNIEDWADRACVPAYYKDIIRIKKLTSYLYTLSIISVEHFDQFYNAAKRELSHVDLELIDRFSISLKKRMVFKNFEYMLGASADSYWNYIGRDKPLNFVELVSPKAKFHIPGREKGILFFPAWTRSNPYQVMFYQAVNKIYNLRVSGFDQQFLTKKVLKENRAEYDYIHLHWLHVFLDVTSQSGADQLIEVLKYAKGLGYEIIYTAHNIVSHESDDVDKEIELRKKVIPLFDVVIAHGEYAKKRLVKEIGCSESKIRVVKHGCYSGFYENCETSEQARKKLGIEKDDYVFLFLGNIRRYKGVDRLVNAFNEISSEKPNAKLIVCGRVDDEKSAEFLERSANENAAIIYRPGFIDDRDLQTYFNGSDVTVLPYRNILSSGAAMLSLTFGTPIIAPSLGVIPEIVSGPEFGFLFSDYTEMKRLMTELAVGRKRNIRQNSEDLSRCVYEEFNWAKGVGALSLFWEKVENKVNEKEITINCDIRFNAA